MTDLRTAAKEALEALTNCNSADGHRCIRCDSEVDEGGKVASALRAALAQQDEPEAYGYASRLAVAIWEKHYKDTAPQWKPLDYLIGVLTQIDNMTSGLTRQAQQDEPVQEPVAWSFEARHIDTAWGSAVSLKHPGREHKYMRNVKPLYLAPPQRKPLTEEEIDRICALLGFAAISPAEIARAVERAHGIGEAK